MIADRDVAVWVGSVPAIGEGQDELWGLLGVCDLVLKPFEAEQLLDARSVVLDDWRANGVVAGRGETSVVRVGDECLEAACRRFFAQQGFGTGTSAELVTIEGSTLIREADGSSVRVAGAIGVQGMLTSMNTIWIRTRSDAWMPSGLLGEEQRERYALNAPRLRRALTQARGVLGGVLSPVPSKIALVNGFDIQNLPVELVRALIDS